MNPRLKKICILLLLLVIGIWSLLFHRVNTTGWNYDLNAFNGNLNENRNLIFEELSTVVKSSSIKQLEEARNCTKEDINILKIVFGASSEQSFPIDIPLIVIDAGLLTCLQRSDHYDCFALKNGLQFRLGVLQSQWERFSQQAGNTRDILTQNEHGSWKGVELMNKDHVLIHLEACNLRTTIIISKIEIRASYWFISACMTTLLDLPPFAILPFAPKLITSLIPSLEKGLSVLLMVPPNMDSFVWQLSRSRYIDCNRTLAQTFVEQNAMFTEQRVPDKRLADLDYLRDLLIPYKMTPVIMFGTNLGWYRECGIIPDTTDFDVAIKYSELHPNIESILTNGTALLLYHIFGKPGDCYMISVVKYAARIDIFTLYEEKNGTAWVGSMKSNTREKIRWLFPLESVEHICTSDLKGHLVSVFCDPLPIIEADYGNEWYIPLRKSNFTWHKDGFNIRIGDKWPDDQWNQVHRTFYY